MRSSLRWLCHAHVVRVWVCDEARFGCIPSIAGCGLRGIRVIVPHQQKYEWIPYGA